MTGWYVHHNGSQRWRVLQHYTERVQHYLDMLQQMDIIGRTRLCVVCVCVCVCVCVGT